MKVLITGGTGYIGQYLSEYLCDKDYRIFITSRSKSGSNVRKLDLLEPKSIKNVCEGMDAVIHLANYDERKIAQNPKEALLANAFSTRLLYEDANTNGVTLFIYLSTFHVYGTDFGVINEASKTRPLTDYGLTHLFAEQYLEQLSAKGMTRVNSIRLSNGIGYPRDGCDKWYLIVNHCCRCAVNEQRIVLNTAGYQTRNFVAIKDVCSALGILLESQSGKAFEIYNVGSRRNYSMREIAYLVAEKYELLCGQKVELVIPETTDPDVREFVFSSDKIRLLGWSETFSTGDIIEEILKRLMSEKGDGE